MLPNKDGEVFVLPCSTQWLCRMKKAAQAALPGKKPRASRGSEAGQKKRARAGGQVSSAHVAQTGLEPHCSVTRKGKGGFGPPSLHPFGDFQGKPAEGRQTNAPE
jgi:hypothetical protein